MVGIPDGLGATAARRAATSPLFMNHELRSRRQGRARCAGTVQNGAFASESSIDSRRSRSRRAQDLVDPGVRYWNYATHQYGPTPSPGPARASSPAAARASSALPAALQPEDRPRLRRPDLLRQRGERRRGPCLRRHDRRAGAAAAAARAVLVGEPLVGLNEGDVTYTQGQEDTPSGQLYVYIGRKLSAATRSTGRA